MNDGLDKVEDDRDEDVDEVDAVDAGEKELDDLLQRLHSPDWHLS